MKNESEVSYKSSVNIKFDLGKNNLFRDYLPTPSHAESLQNILDGFNGGNNNNAHIMIGAYGTGKSLLGTLIGGMASKSVSSDSMSLLMKKFSSIDDTIYKQLKKIENNDKKFLPIILNGNEGSFRQSILSSITRVLDENNINIVIPGIIQKILLTIEMWELEYPKTYKNFKKLIKESGRDLLVWRVNIQNYESAEIEWFKTIFPLLSSGAEFQVDFKEDFIDQVSYVITELEKQDLGLFIMYDEFGRFLQSVDVSMIHETMQDLQDLAELTARHSESLHLLFITHKNLRHYFYSMNEEYQNEFQRIEKRFRIYHIESDRSTFIRIAESILSRKNINRAPDDLQSKLNGDLRRYPLFPNLNQVELEELVVKGVFPIHPVTLFILPHMSSQFAQNERTLFTFLQSNEEYGLNTHILQSPEELYLPSKLFDFFLSDLNGYSYDSNIKLYKKLSKRLMNTEDDLHDLFKFMIIWTMCNLNNYQKLTTDFLSFAMNQNSNDISKKMDRLAKLKIIHFNRILDEWEIFEGSSIDINRELDLRKESINLTLEEKKSILEESISKKFFLANDYNDKKSMTRFANVNVIIGSEIIKGTYNEAQVQIDRNADAIVNYVFLDSLRDYEEVLELIKNLESDYAYYAIAYKSLTEIDEELLNYHILKQLINDKEFLQNNSELLKELTLKLEDLSHSFKRFIKTFINFESNLTWIYKGETKNISNHIFLEKELSDLMYKLYPLTPEIRNDSFVRREINVVQKKAAIKVLDHILSDYPKNIKIEGNGPDYLIYATVFKNNGLDVNKLSNIEQVEYRELRIRLIDCLRSKTEHSLNDLKLILQKEPFGLRKPLVPLLLVSLLRDKWDQIMFYRNGMFIPNITAEKLFKMVDEASEYSFIYYDYDEKFNPLFDKLKTIFKKYVSENTKNSSTPIILSSGLLNWLRLLPRFTQITTDLDDSLSRFRDTIKRCEIDPKWMLENLFDTYNDNFSRINEHKEKLENYVGEYKDEIKKMIYKLVSVNNYKELYEWSLSKNAFAKKNSLLVSGLLVSNEENWIDEVIECVVGVPLNNWSDTTNQMFEQLIIKDYYSIDADVEEDNYLSLNLNGYDKVISKVDLSTKTQTIYKNVHRMINNAGRNVPKEELEYMVYILVKDFIK